MGIKMFFHEIFKLLSTPSCSRHQILGQSGHFMQLLDILFATSLTQQHLQIILPTFPITLN